VLRHQPVVRRSLCAYESQILQNSVDGVVFKCRSTFDFGLGLDDSVLEHDVRSSCALLLVGLQQQGFANLLIGLNELSREVEDGKV
jgi:hypothetical protein